MKKQTLIVLILVAVLAISTSANISQFMFNQQLRNTNIGEANIYYNEFGVIPSTNVNSSFIPPVSMYRALQIALETDGWNKASLRGMTVNINLMHGDTITNSSTYFTGIDGEVTSPPANYSNVYGDGDSIIYRYIWEIAVNNASSPGIPPLGFSLVDAVSGVILPNPPLI